MPRRQKEPLRPLTLDEQRVLQRLGRAQTEPAALVVRAKALLAVAAGQSFTAAAQAAGRTSGAAVAHLVARFNREGLMVVTPTHGGGQPKRSTAVEQERVLHEARRPPDREGDGTGTWSLATLWRALRQAPDGLPTVSTATIWTVLHDAGFRWQRDRSWCETGVSVRKRKSGTVTVHDPDVVAKRTRSKRRIGKQTCRCGPRTRRDRSRSCPIPARTGNPSAGRCGIRTTTYAAAPRSN